MPPTDSFQGEIRVASRIVDYLSSGLYKSPAACLKELINNSFDADASLVEVFVKPDADRIIIEDDGSGMNRKEFEQHFQRISESHKRDAGEATQKGRRKIGMIGIGAIAANELCDEMEILSTKAGESEQLHVTIRFDKMRLPVPDRRREGDLAKADYVGETSPTDPESHFTRIFLKRVRGQAKAILVSPARHPASSSVRTLYGLKPATIVNILRDSSLRSWSEFDNYSQTMLQVALSVPVTYYPDWVVHPARDKVAILDQRLNKDGFRVRYDGSELHQPIVFSPGGRSLLQPFAFSGRTVSAIGYLYAQHGTMRPQDLQGLLIRIRDVAVGDYDATFLDFPSRSGPLFQRWVSAEVWADDRLEPAMNIDRRTLRTSHPAFVELQKAVHVAVDAFLRNVRKQLYGAGSEDRERQRASHQASAITSLIHAEEPRIGAKAAKEMVSLVEAHEEDRVLQRRLTHRFTAEELLRLVLEVAREVLDAPTHEEFVRLLMRRLTR